MFDCAGNDILLGAADSDAICRHIPNTLVFSEFEKRVVPHLGSRQHQDVKSRRSILSADIAREIARFQRESLVSITLSAPHTKFGVCGAKAMVSIGGHLSKRCAGRAASPVCYGCFRTAPTVSRPVLPSDSFTFPQADMRSGALVTTACPVRPSEHLTERVTVGRRSPRS